LVLDSRLTPLAESKIVGPDGYKWSKLDLPPPGAVKVTLEAPAGAVLQPTEMRLTGVSTQGLPGLLPLGGSSLAAFDPPASGDVAGGLTATVEALPPGTVHLVRFDTAARAWVMEQSGLEVEPGTDTSQGQPLTVTLSGLGSWALVVPDADPAPVVPGPGI